MNPLKYIEIHKEITQRVNTVLQAHNLRQAVHDDIKVVSKTLLISRELSDIINDYIWPRIQVTEVYHFTSLLTATNIVNNSLFRLTSISKNYSANEVVTFCESHEFDGWLQEQNGEPIYKQDMENTYIGCFADANVSDEEQSHLWSRFASSNGVRLKFKITVSAPAQLRKVIYESNNQPILLINQLNRIAEQYKLKLCRQSGSTLAAFYLPAKEYEVEHELRVIFRDWGLPYIQIIDSNTNGYIEVPLNQETQIGIRLNLLEWHSHEIPKKLPHTCQYNPRA